MLLRTVYRTLVSIITSVATLSCSQQTIQPPYTNQQLPIDERVNDLVSRMTLEEKVSQTLNQAPAIERLGIAQYNWWSEALHGVARAGLATVFPQAIGLAASWDEDMMLRVASAISDEARAKHHAFAARDKRFIYQGLTLWSPNINIFRDPRWGRGQETYGEDPHLTGRMAVQFIRGLQGEHPHYLKTVATVKHFAVHSGPEPERHEFDARATPKELYEFYLPQFEMAIKEAKPYSLMCAYNRYNGEPACASPLLLQNILRDKWQFDGFVVSDCGAIEDLHKHHKVTQSPEESAAISMQAGTDLNCGTIYHSLIDAVRKGLIKEETIDVAVKRLMTARMKLGMFDAPDTVPYTRIPYSVVDSPKHRALALEAAQKSIVLLKNENHTLPLKKDLRSIAVIGPNADQWLMLLGNYNGVPADPITPLRGIREKLTPHTEIHYAQGSELAQGIPMLTPIPASVFSHDGNPGLKAEFFDNITLQGEPRFNDVYSNIDVNWHDKSPHDSLDDDHFSVRWKGNVTPSVSGFYQFGSISTCNTKVYLDDTLIVSTPYHFRDEYGDPRTKKSDWIELLAGHTYQIEVTAVETYADAQVQIVWAPPQSNLLTEAIETAQKAEAVVLVMGLTPRMEGEEMNINVDGFRGGDRTKLQLPKIQQQLIQRIAQLKKPTILVLLNGSAVAINWEDENIPAIIEAWYPGQAAGQAIADVIFGDYNPAGRLPVTFYRSADDLPAFDDYRISNQTYRYFEGEVLYPFGHGLSFSQFAYKNLTLSDLAQLKEDISFSIEVENISDVDGDEVIQVYVSPLATQTKGPKRQLVEFQRVHIPANTQRIVQLTIPATAFSVIDEQGNRVFKKGDYEISIGGGQPHQKSTNSSTLIKKLHIN